MVREARSFNGERGCSYHGERGLYLSVITVTEASTQKLTAVNDTSHEVIMFVSLSVLWSNRGSPVSHVTFQKLLCRLIWALDVGFWKTQCRPIKFKKLLCPMSLSYRHSMLYITKA